MVNFTTTPSTIEARVRRLRKQLLQISDVIESMQIPSKQDPDGDLRELLADSNRSVTRALANMIRVSVDLRRAREAESAKTD